MKPKQKKRGQGLAERLEEFSERAREGSREHIQENIIDRLPNARRVRLLILEWCLLIVVIISRSYSGFLVSAVLLCPGIR